MRRLSASAGRAFLARYGTALAALVLLAAFALTAPNFASVGNLLGIAKQVATIAILATGFTLALTVAELDLSFANVATLAAIVTGTAVARGAPVPVACASGMAVGLAAGVLNGALVVGLRIPSLIATLATASIANGVSFWATDGVSIVGRWPRGFTDLARAAPLGVPALVWWMFAVTGAALVFLKRTRTGFRMVCTGEAERAASLAGISTRRLRVLGLALSGGCAGLAAVLLAASLSSAAPGMAADDLLTSIAAVMLGMTTIEPGRPNIPGTLIGALTIGMLANGLVLLGAPYYVQDICLGAIIIASVAVSAGARVGSALRL